VYQYGQSDKKVLLVHGWSGRGTQLVKIADALLKSGYSTISFDALESHLKSDYND
jgi:esterase/lipase